MVSVASPAVNVSRRVRQVETSPLKLIDFGLATYCRENEELTDAYGHLGEVKSQVMKVRTWTSSFDDHLVVMIHQLP